MAMVVDSAPGHRYHTTPLVWGLRLSFGPLLRAKLKHELQTVAFAGAIGSEYR
jgi:hypothetical protein